jgi:hypothetical protein
MGGDGIVNLDAGAGAGGEASGGEASGGPPDE